MSETPEQPVETTSPIVTAEPRSVEPLLVAQKPSRLYQIAAWVAIVAGVVFIVSTIFFWGFFLAKHSGGDGHFRHHGSGMMDDRGGPPMRHGGGPGGPGFGPGGPGGQGNWGPGPGNFGPGGPGQGNWGPDSPGNPGNPGQPPSAPATPPGR